MFPEQWSEKVLPLVTVEPWADSYTAAVKTHTRACLSIDCHKGGKPCKKKTLHNFSRQIKKKKNHVVNFLYLLMFKKLVDVSLSVHRFHVDVAAGGLRPERSQRFLPEPAHPQKLQQQHLGQHECRRRAHLGQHVTAQEPFWKVSR